MSGNYVPQTSHYICEDCDSTYTLQRLEHRMYAIWKPYCTFCDGENIHYVQGDDD